MTMKLTGQRCQCTGCGEYFNRVSTFDKHRVGEHGVNRHCLTEAQMTDKGWSRNAAGFWITAPRTTAMYGNNQ
jgi:hypothetical protein